MRFSEQSESDIMGVTCHCIHCQVTAGVIDRARRPYGRLQTLTSEWAEEQSIVPWSERPIFRED